MCSIRKLFMLALLTAAACATAGNPGGPGDDDDDDVGKADARPAADGAALADAPPQNVIDAAQPDAMRPPPDASPPDASPGLTCTSNSQCAPADCCLNPAGGGGFGFCVPGTRVGNLCIPAV